MMTPASVLPMGICERPDSTLIEQVLGNRVVAHGLATITTA